MLKSYQRFTMGQNIIGITRLQDISDLLSGANHIDDISFEKNYATLCGFTEKEIIDYFQVHIKELAKELKSTDDTVLARIKEEYNGYKFLFEDCESVYNPISIIGCFSSKGFDRFWCNTGSSQKLKELYENYAMSEKSKKDFVVNVGINNISYKDPNFIQFI